MLITTRVLDKSLNSVFQAHTEIDARNLVTVAKSREELARSKGPDWTAGAIPVFGKKLIDVMRTAALGDEIDRAAIDVAMAAWLFDSAYGGLNEEAFIQCDLEFTMLQDGTVKYDRRPGSA